MSTTVTSAPRSGLHGIDLHDLSEFSLVRTMPGTPLDHWLFYVGFDDVHGLLHKLHGGFSEIGKGSMFGFDDPVLNEDIIDAGHLPNCLVQWTLDASQSGTPHEASILKQDFAANPELFNTWFKIMKTSTDQIEHTKGGVLDGAIGYEGSTNWSTSGEGSFVTNQVAPGGPGYKAQANTLMVFTDQPTIVSFGGILDKLHANGKLVTPTDLKAAA